MIISKKINKLKMLKKSELESENREWGLVPTIEQWWKVKSTLFLSLSFLYSRVLFQEITTYTVS